MLRLINNEGKLYPYINMNMGVNNMDFKEFKNTINLIGSCDPVEGWDFNRMITLLENVVLKLDDIEKHVDEGVDRITEKLDD